MFSFGIVKDDISPALTKMARAAKRPIEVFRAMGTTFKSITEGTFNSAGAAYRPAPWPAKKDGTPSILQKSGTMAKSFHLDVTERHAALANPMPYARIHQFGSEGHVAGKVVGTIKTKYASAKYAGSWNTVTEGGKGIPPRPFYPIGPDGKLTPMAYDVIAKAGHRALARQIGARE